MNQEFSQDTKMYVVSKVASFLPFGNRFVFVLVFVEVIN